MKNVVTIGQVAKHFGCQLWQVRRLFERGILPEPERIGQQRVIKVKELPKLGAALKKAGYVK